MEMSIEALRAENAELQARLREAEDTLAAIRGGEVEALVVQTADGPKIYGLTSAEAASSQLRGEMLAQIGEAVVAVDTEQRITYFNAAAERHFGCSARHALGRRIGRILRIVWRDPADESSARRALDDDGAWRGECLHRLPDGRELAVDVGLSALRDAAGQRTGTLAVVRDVSARRRSEDALRRLTERFDAALAAAPVILFEQDQELRYTWVHDPALGVRAQDIVGRRDSEILPDQPEYAARLERIKRAVLDSGQARHEEVEQRGDEGTTHCFDLTVQPRRDDAGRVVGVICAALDLTEHKRAESAHAELAERLQLAMRTAALGMWDWDLRSDAVRWSDECHAIFGVAPGGFAGTLDAYKARVHPDDRARVLAAVRTAVEQRALYESEFRILRADDGQERWVANLGRLLCDESGQPLRMIGTVADITERRRADQALRDEAQRKDEFLALLAHELRNPLAPIRMTVGLLSARAADDALLARCRDIIDRQSAQMARLLDDLLDVSRLARGKVTLQSARVALGEVLDAALETSRPLIEQRAQELLLDLDPHARALTLDGDAARLVQVFANLLNNASKYSHPGGRIELSAHADEDHALVRVRDHGIGIAPEVMPRLFELFVQAGEARRHAPGGLGIGLALASQLVQTHGGTLTVRSAGPGQGSEFSVRLPLSSADAAAGAEPADPHAPLSPLPRRRVLVVDDNVDAADTTAMLLGSLGCEVGVAYDGEAALREAERLCPEVVLLDLGMHGLDGYEVCRRLRARPWGMAMTLVALSGWGQEEDRRRSAKAGFDLHLAKPVAPAVLIDVVRDARLLDE
jgi:PAS domain S-box-containing protein